MSQASTHSASTTSASTARRAARRIVLAAGFAASAAIGLVAGAAPASAQFYIDEPEIRLSPRGLVAGLARRGYREITHPFFDGDTYTVEADDHRGIRVRLVIDAFDGAVLDRVRAELPPVPPRLVGRPAAPGYGWTEEEPAPPEARAPRRVERAPARPAAVAAASPPPAAGVSGLNPDAARPARPAPEPRKTARVPEPKPAEAAREALKPALAPAAPVPPVTKPEAAKPAEAPKSDVARTDTKSEAPKAEAKPVEAERPVRVIGGVTPVVPAPPAPALEAPAE